ncbi:MAG: IS21 family transposase [Bryobacterales bacterium]|nr:IS21 family transposase [Bryobacterales bacterium]
MITPEIRVQIRRYFYAEHWKIGTIAQALNVHPDTVRRAIEVERFQHAEPLRPSIVDPYLPFVREMLEQHPHLRATLLYQMIRDRGYSGSVEQLRRAVARLRPQPHEAFLRLQVFRAEQAQVDWACFGSVMVGRARRQLSCFVMTLSWSRALYLEFFFDQTTENFLRGHVRAFQDWSGAPRVILYDNLKSAVLERRGNQIHFNPRLLELAGHYHFAPRPCQVRAGNQKGRVERAIRYVRDSFWAGRVFTTLAECNRQALAWRDEVAHLYFSIHNAEQQDHTIMYVRTKPNRLLIRHSEKVVAHGLVEHFKQLWQPVISKRRSILLPCRNVTIEDELWAELRAECEDRLDSISATEKKSDLLNAIIPRVGSEPTDREQGTATATSNTKSGA